ncbi:ThuA domain-containing protein [Christiangramia sp.]|uniref:ThuA domain-containing protein n=1 Tax=Christiangramia sp. TaxID=1931228 RepID=UPI00262B4EB2|nr:ThuA domain-containing protein [Christiangramia sp.]
MRYLIVVFVLLFGVKLQSQDKQVLIFSKTEGFRHNSIETGIQAIQEIGDALNFKSITSQDSRFFTENDMSKINLVIFLNTTGDILNMEEQTAFQNYMDNGGNFFGIHAAADTEFNWNWYGDLVGAYFKGHPEIQEAVINVKMPQHPTVEHLRDNTWKRTDEWYNYKDIANGLNVLLSLDDTSYSGGENGDFHPIAWYQNYRGGGVSIYTGGGHTIESYSEPNFREHLRKCIEFALGN